jgi:hypothetical protein
MNNDPARELSISDLMTTTAIAERNGYTLERHAPTTGRVCYSITRNGKTVSRTFQKKRVALKALWLVANMRAPILDSQSEWLRASISQYGHCGQ